MEFSIAGELRERWPDAALGLLCYEADVAESTPEELAAFDGLVKELENRYRLEDIAGLAHIDATRRAYRALGKSPHEYRNAAEAMLRRVVKGNGLYHINNVVEVNNYISIASGYSIGSYDLSELRGSVQLKRAEPDSHYEGIGKGSVNIGCLPVLYDERGAFGNPTSDSRRAMIREGRRKIASVLYSFDGTGDLHRWMEEFETLLQKFCGVSTVQKKIIS